MNILFFTRYDPKDINNWSGTLYYMFHKLREKHHVEILGTELLGQLLYFSKENYLEDYFLPVDRYVKNISCILSERVNALEFDLIFLATYFFTLLMSLFLLFMSAI